MDAGLGTQEDVVYPGLALNLPSSSDLLFAWTVPVIFRVSDCTMCMSYGTSETR